MRPDGLAARPVLILVRPSSLCGEVPLPGRIPMRFRTRSGISARVSSPWPETGKGMTQAFVWLGILCFFIYVCWLIVPIYINNYQLQDELRNEARFAVFEHKDQSQVQADVYRAARALGLPVTREDIAVVPIYGGYRITVRYAVRLEILHHNFVLHLHPSADSNSV